MKDKENNDLDKMWQAIETSIDHVIKFDKNKNYKVSDV